MRRLPATVVVLGLVSLLNDVASDMIAPLLPLFLASALGAGPAAIGLIEGVAEATSSLLKLWSGRLGDRGIGHKRLAVSGYTLSNALRPLIGLAASWPIVLVLRFGDRVGKGLRTSPRDALLALSVPETIRGRAFGLHRSMDHAGAMLGPLVASALLAWGLGMREVFLASVIPGVLAVAVLIAGVREVRQPAPQTPAPLRWSRLPARLRGLVLAAGGLSLAAVPDAFLVLWLSRDGVSVHWIPLLWALAHGVKSLVALPAGRLSDRLGRLPVLLGGWSLRAGLLALMPWFVGNTPAVVALFLFYAAAAASTEGAERALIGDAADPSSRGTAFGIYHMLVGLLALPGALWFGAVWESINMETAFLVSAGLTLLAALFLARQGRRASETPPSA
ncbi:MAG TPA: MFS transporter [Gammaproteobacteria bacterium]|nr:MFS transporter [Gammaproteobacteria bacterium]